MLWEYLHVISFFTDVFSLKTNELCFFPCLFEVEEVPVSDVTCQKYTTFSVELHFNIVRANKLPNKTPTQGSRLTN